MDIKINDEQMREIVSGAVLQVMGTECRDTIMKAAIEHLITPVASSDRWGSNKGESPLQNAFNSAVNTYAYGEANEWLKNNEAARERIRTIYVAAWEKMVSDYKGDLIEKIAKSMADALTKDRY